MAEYDPRLGVFIAASAVAQSAICNEVTRFDVDDLQTKADCVLDYDDPLCIAVMGFCTQYELWKSEPSQVDLPSIGRTLRDAAMRATEPDPVDADRADIHG